MQKKLNYILGRNSVLRRIGKCCLRYYHLLLYWWAVLSEKQESTKDLYVINEQLSLAGYTHLDYHTHSIKPLCETIADVSIIIPVFNAEAYLERCLDSIISQKTRFTFEIICVNDGSTDGSTRILETYSRNSEINNIIIINQENGGASKARNTGLINAKGKYIAFIDSDDYLLSDQYIEKLLCCAFENKADIVQAGYHSVSAGGKILSAHPKEAVSINVQQNKKKLYEMCSGFLWSSVIKKSLFEKVRFAEGFWFEDMMTRMLLARLAKVYCSLEDCLYAYSLNPYSLGHSISLSSNIKSIDNVFLVKALYEYGKRNLGLEDDSYITNILIQELSVVTTKRVLFQPIWVKKAVFNEICELMGEVSECYEFYNHQNQKFYNIIEGRRFRQWYHLSVYLACK